MSKYDGPAFCGFCDTPAQTTRASLGLCVKHSALVAGIERDKDKAAPFLKPKRKRRKALRGPRHKGRPLPRSFT